jgi:hypothetical protein
MGRPDSPLPRKLALRKKTSQRGRDQVADMHQGLAQTRGDKGDALGTLHIALVEGKVARGSPLGDQVDDDVGRPDNPSDAVLVAQMKLLRASVSCSLRTVRAIWPRSPIIFNVLAS